MGGWGSWDDQADMHQRFVSEPCGWCSTTRNTTTRNGRRPVGGREGRLLVGDAAALGPADRARSRTPPGVDDRRAGAVERPSPGDPGTATRQRDLAEGLGVFRAGGARPPTEAMVAFIDAHRAPSGVEPICAVMPIAPSTHYAHKACQANPQLRSGRAQRDAWLKDQIHRVRDENFAVYGAHEIWRQLNRERSRWPISLDSLHGAPRRIGDRTLCE